MQDFNQQSAKEGIANMMAKAAEAGITEPVALVFDLNETEPRDLLTRLTGSIPAANGGQTSVAITSRPEAVCGLRQHAGKAGILIARSLEQDIPVNLSGVLFLRNRIKVHTETDGRSHFSTVIGYEDAEWLLHWSTPRSVPFSFTTCRMEFVDGRSVPLCFEQKADERTIIDTAEKTALLIETALRRNPSGEAPEAIIATMLCSLGYCPSAIAEAIRALGKLGIDTRWLIDLLHAQPDLQSLASNVEQELARESP